jgi:YegS/Rv2252/BmrU family lipid kinase
VKALFVVNRRSGIRRRRDISAIITETFSKEHEVAECEAKGDLDALIERAVREKFEVVYAVGGDGTVHEVAKRLIGTPMALGILPTGSGNGFARHLGLPLDVRDSLRASQRITTIDTATVNSIPFVGTMGVGFDAWVAEQFAGSAVRGLRTYLRLATSGLFGYVVEEYEMEIDGQRSRKRALLIAIANASQYGNNARIAPLASLQDGMLDVVLVERASPIAAARLFNGTIHRARGVTVQRGQKIRIERPNAGPVHLDGEPVTLPASLTIEVVPQSLRVLVPEIARAI